MLYRRWRMIGALLIALHASVNLPADAQPVVGDRVQAFAGPADRPMFMPTDVAVAESGRVYVADGVRHRVVVFDPAGDVVEEFDTVGDESLSLPLNLIVDRSGALWIADGGTGRVVVRGKDGELIRSINLPPDAISDPIDLGGLALGPQGQFLWLTNNDHHRLIRYELASNKARVFGQLGESLGQFHYPYTLTCTTSGEVLVTDVINGRVQRLDDGGVPTGSIGSYGVDVGQFYRPKGVALDADGNVWVSDGTLNVVQAFTQDGRLIGVLRNADGEPMRFASPMGLTFDAAGALYVVELLEHHVVKVAVQRDPKARPKRVGGRRRGMTIGPQARSCTACHFEWMQPLVENVSTELADVPPNPTELPWVSREIMCLGCHDGSVGDSRRRVWVEHGHTTGIEPPESIRVPDKLPLAYGKIECRTCHSAHTLPESRTTIEEIVFLRIDDKPQDLCTECHDGFTGGIDHGMHPLAEMPAEVPPELVHIDSAHTRSHVTCLACHTGHGAQHDALLVLDPSDNELCLACHVALEPELFAADNRSMHGRRPLLAGKTLEVAKGFDSRIGPGKELLCATCHVSHSAPTPHDLLAFDPAQQDTCAECHSDRGGVVDTSHDLRTSHPDIPNVVGMTPRVGGACSGCHTAHRDAREPKPTAYDPAGRCTNCHAAGQLASEATLTDINHPETACGDCHDPHIAKHGNYLTTPVPKLCRDCHAEQFTLDGGPHDVRVSRPDWPKTSQDAGDQCRACHLLHGNERTGLFRAGLANAGLPSERSCLVCHEAVNPSNSGDLVLMHPRTGESMQTEHGLPVATHEDQPHVVCSTCHDPHRGEQQAGSLLRVAGDETSEDMCLTCHQERANIHMIGHAHGPMREAGFEIGACLPCHVTHANPKEVEPRFMWPMKLAGFDGIDDVAVIDRHCVACHREGGPVEPPAIATHPDAVMFNPIDPNAPNFLPLFNAAGKVDPQGEIGCHTCHLTHGRSERAAVPATVSASSERELRARAWHVRSFGAQNVCTTCHGTDGLRRFMYFHDPARRGGPIEGGSPQ